MASSLSAGATAAIPPRDPWNAVATVSGNTYVDVYTVPTGKTLYITAVFIAVGSTATGGLVRVDSTDVIDLELPAGSFAPLVGGATAPLLTLTAGEVLKARSTVGGTSYFNLSGFEL